MADYTASCSCEAPGPIRYRSALAAHDQHLGAKRTAGIIAHFDAFVGLVDARQTGAGLT